ncbi:DUF1080 domain-containing protein [Bacteroidetes bacterium SCGC AAA795-G10]|nr:DUF1080 domain-containing protein [Bacteroidetes bacterium SCGC AAA795-G10]
MTCRIIILLSIAFVSCKQISKESNKETSKKPESSWLLLSQQDSFRGWHIYQNEDGGKSGWTVENGIFTFNASNATGEGNKSLLTDEVFESFEIEFEWMVSPGSNSGFMWGVSEDKMYEHPHVTGPEIQVIDADIYGDDPDHQKHTVGALYDMIPPSSKPSKKAGEWNKYHIIVNHNKNKGTVFLNGIIVNSFPLTGPEWDSMVENSKFRDMSGFGKYKKGHITLQDHPGIISYKNIKIKKL